MAESDGISHGPVTDAAGASGQLAGIAGVPGDPANARAPDPGSGPDPGPGSGGSGVVGALRTSGAGGLKSPRPRGASGASPPSGVLLEYFHKTVTAAPEDDEGAARGCLHYRLSICGCGCWFCGDCCAVKGYKLRARLIPVLESYTSIMMLTFTVDPTLFDSPLDAYLYMRDERCLSRTMQDLRRAGHLHSKRYFYVVEWQRRTEQVHYHVLVDATFIPWGDLLDSWSKHRPPEAGPPPSSGENFRGRPAFGTVIYTKRCFPGGPVHAARYATKYLTKLPASGFPEWVMRQGKERRIKRYGTSRGFWPPEVPPPPKAKKLRHSTSAEDSVKRAATPRTYERRASECGTVFNAFVMTEWVNPSTGEVEPMPRWIGQLRADKGLLTHIDDGQNPRRRRRDLTAHSDGELMRQIKRHSDGRKAAARPRASDRRRCRD